MISIERNGYRLNLRIKNLERQIRRGQRARNSHANAAQVVHVQHAAGDDHGTVALAHAAAATHQRVVLLQIRIGMKADGRHVVEGLFAGAAVQGLDVAERVGKAVAGHTNLVGRQAIKHEGIVGIGAMGNGDFVRGFHVR